MEIEFKKIDDFLVVKPLEKSIEAGNSRDFKSKVIEKIDQGNKKIVINLSKIEFMDSSALGCLISLLKNLASQKGIIVLCEVQEPVKRILSLTRLNQVFSISSNEEDAIKNSLSQ